MTLEQKLAIINEAKSSSNSKTAKNMAWVKILGKMRQKLRAELNDLENSAKLKYPKLANWNRYKMIYLKQLNKKKH